METPEPIEPTLEQRMRTDPDDVATALVYADWLQQREHPRGFLIAQHAELVARPHDLELQRQVASLCRQLLGWDRADVEVAWHLGFIRSAKLHGAPAGDPADVVEGLLTSSSARFLTSLELGCARNATSQVTVASLLRRDRPPPLRRLVLSSSSTRLFDDMQLRIGDLDGIDAIYPNLEELAIEGASETEFNRLSLPVCKRFAFRHSRLSRRSARAIACAPWPNLEELELWLKDPIGDDRVECRASDLQPFFDQAIPTLRRLRFIHSPFVDELLHRVVDAPFIGQIDTLDFTCSAFTDRSASLIATHRPRFRDLKLVVMTGCRLSRAGREVLASLDIATLDDSTRSRGDY